MAKKYTEIDLAPLIDHSLLTVTATPAEVEQWCEEADRFGFASVCVYPTHVRQAVDLLHGKSPKVSTVIGFPSGMNTSSVKLYEAQEAVENGARELDVMINISWLKTGQTEAIHREIAEICQETEQLVKVILETAFLTEADIRLAAEVCMDAGAAYLKTSTGWMSGATIEVVRLLKSITNDRIGIKAAGGIRTAEQALELVLAGATRLGTSRSVEILLQRDTLEEGANPSQTHDAET
jgi:deoxyribose-phosphate aldolase